MQDGQYRKILASLHAANEELRMVHRDYADLSRKMRESAEARALLERDLHRLQQSKSWKITRWLRIIEPMLRRRHGREHILGPDGT